MIKIITTAIVAGIIGFACGSVTVYKHYTAPYGWTPYSREFLRGYTTAQILAYAHTLTPQKVNSCCVIN